MGVSGRERCALRVSTVWPAFGRSANAMALVLLSVLSKYPADLHKDHSLYTLTGSSRWRLNGLRCKLVELADFGCRWRSKLGLALC